MTRNSHISYDDFVSLVENSNPATYWQDNEKNANENFKFVDMEIGKIYAFMDGGNTWFLTAVHLTSEHDYSVYWSYYSPGEGLIEHCIQHPPLYELEWDGMVWNGSRWIILDIQSPFKYMNWLDENPLEVKG